MIYFFFFISTSAGLFSRNVDHFNLSVPMKVPNVPLEHVLFLYVMMLLYSEVRRFTELVPEIMCSGFDSWSFVSAMSFFLYS